MHDLQMFASALQGDDTLLRSLVGPHDSVCVAAESRSVFLVETGADATQSGTLARVGKTGGGSVSLVRLPRSFPVHRIDHDAERFVVTGTDGRSVHGTPGQFTRWVKILDREHNAAYEHHLEAAFLATHLIPDDRPQPTQLDTDAVLGTIRLDDVLPAYETTVPIAGGKLRVSFDSAGPEHVIALLPQARRLVTAFDDILGAGAEFLWNWGADGAEPAAEKARFLGEVLPPSDLIIYRSGDFEVHFCEAGGGSFFADGYWPAVLFKADMTPVAVTVEA